VSNSGSDDSGVNNNTKTEVKKEVQAEKQKK
jgi:hypothetical protein